MTGGMEASGRRCLGLIVIVAGLTARCGNINTELVQLSEARRLSANLLIEFSKAADAANRAVMADTDALSTADAQEAEAAKQAVQTDMDRLTPILQALKFTDETRLLQQFAAQFTEYKTLDRRILDLAVENTNLKAQRLSFGPAQTAADAFRDSIEAVVPGREPWRVKALVATAVSAVREIQALQAPHIAEPEDASMTRLESRMAAAERVARKAIDTLPPLVEPASRPHLAAAATTLDRFMELNAQIIALSVRNTNVRSLALSLDEKRKLTSPCEETLRALQAALGTHRNPSQGRFTSAPRKP